jgi:hypothetical protein
MQTIPGKDNPIISINTGKKEEGNVEIDSQSLTYKL